MSQVNLHEQPPADRNEKQSSGTLELLIVFASYKKFIVGLTAVFAIIAALISLILPNVYKSSARLLPPQQQQSSAAALLSQLGGVGGLGAGVAALKNPNDLYIAMLKSRTVADRLVLQFDLKNAYETKSLESARKELALNTIVASGKDGLITIEVEDEDQKKVAPMTNAYVAELLRLTRTLAVTEASQRRIFYERELEAAKDNLAKAEILLKNALDSRGVISVDADSRAVVETVAKLRAQVSAKEIQLSSMKAFVTTTNPEFLRVEEELKSLRLELSRLENGTGASGTPNATPIGLENIKVLRNVKYYQMLYELLSKQYEVARLDEAKNSAIIQVLDPAVEPEKKVKPKRVMMVLMGTFFGLIASFILAFLLNLYKRSLHNNERAARWEELHSMLRLRKTKSQ